MGYSWLPLTRDNKYELPHLVLSENVQEFDLPVSSNLPTNYIDAYATNGKDGSSNMKIRPAEYDVLISDVKEADLKKVNTYYVIFNYSYL
jgi:hypothetical protein